MCLPAMITFFHFFIFSPSRLNKNLFMRENFKHTQKQGARIMTLTDSPPSSTANNLPSSCPLWPDPPSPHSDYFEANHISFHI